MCDRVKIFKRAARKHEDLAKEARIQAFTSEDWVGQSQTSARHYDWAIKMYYAALHQLDEQQVRS